jgi:uncharacterized protein
MLIEFSVGNYRSFKEKVTFSMVAANLVSQDKNLDSNNVFAVDEELSLVKSAAIYGANASGKSNLAEALQFMKWFMVNSSKETQSTERISVERFRLSTETDDQPSFFEIVFLLNGQQHRYGFTVSQEKVVSEWLYYVPKIRETKLFNRQGDEFDVSTLYKAQGITERTRSNALFLSVSAQFNMEKSESILKYFTSDFLVTFNLNDMALMNNTIDFMLKQKAEKEITDFMLKLDLGITELRLRKLRKGDVFTLENIKINRVAIMHEKFDDAGEPFSLEEFEMYTEESAGTQKIFALASLIVHTLKIGGTLIIDEFDARLHSLMSRAILKIFNSNENNPRNAQLIAITHDTNLLSNKIFRRDQVWFTEKDRYGATALYSLAEYKVRNDASYGNDYIKGKYGAIPYIQGTESLIEAHG